MKRRWLAPAALVSAASVVALGCGLIISPTPGIASISTLVLAAPSVVLGDILRDSLGAPAPLLVNAYNGAGNLVTGITTQYFVLDSIPTVSVDSNGLLHGLKYDTLGAHVVAQVGTLQTPPQVVFVAVHPDAVTAEGTISTLQFSDTTTPDTLQAANWSDTLALNVHSINGIGAQGFIVEYAIVQSPATISSGLKSAYIGNDVGLAAARDTTDLHGEAHRRVVLNRLNIADAALLAGTKTDTIIVQATVRYGGANVPGSPVIFLIPVSAMPILYP